MLLILSLAFMACLSGGWTSAPAQRQVHQVLVNGITPTAPQAKGACTGHTPNRVTESAILLAPGLVAGRTERRS